MDNLKFTGPWISIGDCKAVTTEEEVSSKSTLAPHRSAGFTDWLFDEGLLHVGFCGPTTHRPEAWIETRLRELGLTDDFVILSGEQTSLMPRLCISQLFSQTKHHSF